MSMSRKIVVATVAILVCGAGLLTVKQLRWKAAQARRDAEYARVLSSYQQALHPGMVRADVSGYLTSHNISYTSISWGGGAPAYAIKIGEDPSNKWYCDHWTVYIGIEFRPLSSEKNEDPLPTDVVREIHIRKLGSCL